MSVTNKEIYDAVDGLRMEVSHRLERVEDDVKDINSWKNNLSGRIAMGVITIGTIVSVVTAVAVSWIKDKLKI